MNFLQDYTVSEKIKDAHYDILIEFSSDKGRGSGTDFRYDRTTVSEKNIEKYFSFINKLSADLKNSNYICENINDNEFFSSDENYYIEIPVKECGFSLYFYHIKIKQITFIPEQTVIEYTKVKNEH